jgi:hypothetical protein
VIILEHVILISLLILLILGLFSLGIVVCWFSPGALEEPVLSFLLERTIELCRSEVCLSAHFEVVCCRCRSHRWQFSFCSPNIELCCELFCDNLHTISLSVLVVQKRLFLFHHCCLLCKEPVLVDLGVCFEYCFGFGCYPLYFASFGQSFDLF